MHLFSGIEDTQLRQIGNSLQGMGGHRGKTRAWQWGRRYGGSDTSMWISFCMVLTFRTRLIFHFLKKINK